MPHIDIQCFNTSFHWNRLFVEEKDDEGYLTRVHRQSSYNGSAGKRVRFRQFPGENEPKNRDCRQEFQHQRTAAHAERQLTIKMAAKKIAKNFFT